MNLMFSWPDQYLTRSLRHCVISSIYFLCCFLAYETGNKLRRHRQANKLFLQLGTQIRAIYIRLFSKKGDFLFPKKGVHTQRIRIESFSPAHTKTLNRRKYVSYKACAHCQ